MQDIGQLSIAPMIVYTATKDDIEELANVEIDSKIKSIPECYDLNEIDLDSRLIRWRTYFSGQSPQQSKPERVVFKAIIHEKIVGYIAGHLTTRYGMDAEIQSLFVLKENQRTGVGQRLLTQFTEWLTSYDAKSLCVGINPNNKFKAFYIKNGGKYFK